MIGGGQRVDPDILGQQRYLAQGLPTTGRAGPVAAVVAAAKHQADLHVTSRVLGFRFWVLGKVATFPRTQNPEPRTLALELVGGFHDGGQLLDRLECPGVHPEREVLDPDGRVGRQLLHDLVR